MNVYKNFDLSLYDYQVADGVARFRVRVAASPAGELRPDEAEHVRLTPEVRGQLRQLEQPRLGRDALVAIGQALADLLLPRRVRELFERSLAALNPGEEGLRIRIYPDTYVLANLPWEFVNVSREMSGLAEDFLVLNQNISLVRREILRSPPRVLAPIGSGPLQMAALLADLDCSPEYPPLHLDVELSKIQEIIQNRLPNVVNPHFYPNATLDTLQDALDAEPHVFHFAGHSHFEGDLTQSYGEGTDKGSVVLMDDDRHPRRLSAERLASSLEGKVRLAVLGACESGRRGEVNTWAGIVPALTRRGIPAVIGLQYTISPDYAIVFIRYLYRELAVEQPIDAAVTEGRRKIYQRSDDDERDWGVPVLYLRADEGRIFPRLAPVVAPTAPSQAAHADQQRRSMPFSFTESSSGSADLRTPGPPQINQTSLRKAIVTAFGNLEELAVLCADVEQRLRDLRTDLPVSLDIVGGELLENRVLRLINYLNTHGHLSVLIDVVREQRGDIV